MELEDFFIEMKMEQLINLLIQSQKTNMNLATKQEMYGVLDLEKFHAVMKNVELIL